MPQKKGYKGAKKLVKAKPKKVAKAKTAKEINGKKKSVWFKCTS